MKGRIFRETIHRISYPTLIIFFLVYITMAGWLYYALTESYPSHGLALPTGEDHLTLLSAMYFSVVTASSLGYGDFVPQGISRGIAVTEILVGYVILGLIIAKAAAAPDANASNIAKIVEGMWIDQMVIDRPKNSQERAADCEVCYGLTNFVHDDYSGAFQYYGENLSRQGKVLHTFRGLVIAINWPMLIIKYENSASAAPDLSRGIEMVMFEYSKGNTAYHYNGEGFEASGAGHRFAGWRLADEEVGKLRNPGAREELVAELIGKYFPGS